MIIYHQRSSLLFHYREKIRQGRAAFLGFLYGAYEQRCFWWEVIDNVRRLSLTGVLVMFPESSRVFAAALFSQFFLVLHVNAQPFALHDNNILQQVANAGISLTFTLLLSCSSCCFD